MAGRSRILSYGLPILGAVLGLAGILQIALSAPDRPLSEPQRMPAVQPPDARGALIGATGLVEPSTEQVRIGAQLSGVVAEVMVRPGDNVPEGAALFRLDDRQARAEVENRRQQMMAAIARLREIEAGIPAARARLDMVQAEAGDRREQLRLVMSVQDRRAVSAEDVSRRRFAAMMSETRVREERANLALLEGGADAPTLAVQRATIEQLGAALAVAETELQRLTVRAPVAGTILQSNLRAGEFAQAGVLTTPLLIMGALDPLHVRVDIDEVDAQRFSPQGRATVSARGQGERRATLRFIRVDPLVVPKTSLTGASTERVDTRVLRVVYALDPRDLPLFAGQQVDVFVEVAGR
jgi:HlyD family secretion protein